METEELFTREDFARITHAWKTYITLKPEGYPENHLFYTLVRNKDPFLAFKPLINPKKIENTNGQAHVTLYNTLNTLQYKLTKHLQILDAYANPTERNAYIKKSYLTTNFQLLTGYEFPLSVEQTNYLLMKVEQYKKVVVGK